MSAALPGRGHGVPRSGPTPVVDPLPATVSELSWTPGKRLPRSQRLRLRLENTRRVVVDARQAGLRCGRVSVASDGPATVVLRRLPGGTRRFAVSGSRTVWLPCR